MSWWDTSAISGLASSALKKAQKGIDKVLEIKDEEEAEATSSRDVRSKTPDKKSAAPEGGDFFNAWLSPSASKPEATDKPKKVRTAPKLSTDSRHSSSSSMADVDVKETKDTKPGLKDPKSLISSGSESAFKTVSSHDSLSATSQSSSMFEELQDDPTKKDEDVFKQFGVSFGAAKKEDDWFTKDSSPSLKIQSKDIQTSEYSPSLNAETSEKSTEKDTEGDTQSEQKTTDRSVKSKGPLRLGLKKSKKSSEAEKTEEKEPEKLPEKPAEEMRPVEADLQASMDVSDTSDKIAHIPVEESPGKLPVLSVSDSFSMPDPGTSDWGDMSLSLLTESQMSVGSNKESGETINADVARTESSKENTTEECTSERQEDVIEKEDIVETQEPTSEKQDSDEKQDDVVEKQDDMDEKPDEGSQESTAADTTEHPQESQPMEETVSEDVKTTEDTAAVSNEESNEGILIKSDVSKTSDESKTSLSTVEDVMEESHESGELSDSNRTITGEDPESEEEDPPDADRSSETDDRDHSSSIMSITEPSSSPMGSPESVQLGSRKDHGDMSSSGYVKNMLEEAMVESQRDTDGSHTGSQADSSSDLVRIESGQTSGHTSADDEIETTTTSSDIEIISHISTPSNGGDYYRGGAMGGMERPFDLSPLRHALSRSMTQQQRRHSPPSHHRSDSGSSGLSGLSFHSGNGHDLVTSPPGMMRHPEPPQHDPSHDRSPQSGPKDEESPSDNPYETDKLLKEGEATGHTLQTIEEEGELLKRLADMAQTLDAREKRLLELSKENVELNESNIVLKNLLKQAEEAREADQTDLHALTEEFTKRIAEAEKRIHHSQKEKEAMKKRAGDLEAEVRNRCDTSSATERLIRDKDEQIAELLEEGEKLSKQQLQSNNIIKKLRAKEKENDHTIKTQREKLDTQKAEIERLQKILDNKCDIEQKQIDAINQLNNMVKKQEKEIEHLQVQVGETQDQARSAQNALDSSYKEIAELHRSIAAAQSEQTSAALSAEMAAKQQLQHQLDSAMAHAHREQEALITQIEELRLSVSRGEKDAGRREDILRQEISDIQQRLQDAEDRNHELTASVSSATRPLLRQIENLQSTHASQTLSYEKIEKNLTDRLAEAQQAASVAVAREREAAEELREHTARLASLDTQCAQLRQDKAKLSALLEMERAKVDMLTDAKNNEVAQLEAQKHQLDADNQELRKERLMLDSQLEMERMRVEAEKKKVMLAHEQLRDKELQLSQMSMSALSVSTTSTLADTTPASDPMLGSMHSSMSGSFMSQESALEHALMQGSGGGLGGSMSRQNLYESLRTAGTTSVMENLQSQLKQREGEVHQLQSEIVELEKTREAMAQELVSLSNKNDNLQEQLRDYPAFKQKYKDLDERYNAMLQMYGEKVEEADELRLDLQDVKDMYKGQIEELLKRYS